MVKVGGLADPGKQQVYGGSNRLNENSLYAFDRYNPTVVYDLTGYLVTEAPEPTETEPAPKEHRVQDEFGYNYTELEHVEPIKVQMQDMTIMIPEGRVDMIDKMLDAQARSYGKQNRFAFFISKDPNCANDCDRYAIMRGFGHLRSKTEVNGLNTSAGSEGGDTGAYTEQVIVNIPGKYLKHIGMDVQQNVRSAIDPVYAVYLGTLQECSGVDSFCPWPIAYYADSEGSSNKPELLKTIDKFKSADIAVDITATSTGQIVTALTKYRGDMYIAVAAAFKADAVSGLLLKSINDGAAVDTGAATAGVHALVVAGNRLHIFGEAGLWKYTGDGENWVTPAGSPLSTTNIYAAAYNPADKCIYAVGEDGAGYQINTVNNVITALTGTGSADLTAVHICGKNHVAIGASDGKLYENYRVDNGVGFTRTKTFGTAAIHLLTGDYTQSRLVVGEGVNVWLRGIETMQEWVTIGTVPGGSGNILSGDIGYARDGMGKDYVLIGTSSGALFEVQTCDPCVDAV